MKILYYSPHPGLNMASPTGYGTHMRSMIAAFRSSGHTVEALIMGGESVFENIETKSKSRVLKDFIKRFVPAFIWESVKHKKRMLSDKRFARLLEKRIREFKPDLVYERASYLQRSGVKTASRLSVSHVLEINTPANAEREFLAQPLSLFHKKAEKIEKWQLENTTLVVVVSPAMIDYFIQKYGVEESKIICTPNGIDVGEISVDTKLVEKVGQELELADKYVVGFVGSMARWQRVDLLISAIKISLKTRDNIFALLVGGTPEKIDELTCMAKKNGIGDKVNFVGSISKEQVPSYISLMDACILPANLWYGSPTKLFEYAAMKKPTIAPDNITVRSIIKDYINGRLTSEDPHDLSQIILELAADFDKSGEMGLEFYRKVTEEFTWNANVKLIVSNHNIQRSLLSKTQ